MILLKWEMTPKGRSRSLLLISKDNYTSEYKLLSCNSWISTSLISFLTKIEFSQVTWLDDAVGSYLIRKSHELFRVITMRNRRIPDIKAVFDQKFIFLSHVTSWWCPELSPPDTLIIFNILFFVLKNEIMDRRRKFYSLHLDFVFFGRRHQFSGPRQQLKGRVWTFVT